MRTWERVTRAMLCGCCGQLLGNGMLAQRVEFSGVKRKLIRCENCADGSAPLDIPALPTDIEAQSRRLTKPMKPLASLAKQAEQTYRLPHPND